MSMTSVTDDLPDFQQSKSDWRVAAALAVLILAFTAPVVHPMGEQQASRYALTASLWHTQDVVITEYSDILGRDLAVRDGVVYSDKAPGQPIWAVPFYGLFRLIADDASPPELGEVDADLWWMTIWSATIPAAVLGALMYLWARDVESGTALAATLTISFGTLVLVYSTLLFGHVLAATLAFGMFMLIRRKHVSTPLLALSGAIGGLAVAVEFPVALIVLVLVVGALVRHRMKGLAVMAGGLPLAALVGLYNARVTGSPIMTPIQWSGFAGVREEANDVVGLFAGPSLERLTHVLFSERGLFVATPVVAIAMAGIVVMYRRCNRFDALTTGFVFVSMLMIQGSWSSSYAGGAGPRYLVPALPFLTAPLAVAWSRWRRTSLVLAALSVLTMGVATLTEPQLGSDFGGGLGFWLALAGSGYLVSTVFTWPLGPAGWVVHLALIGLTFGLILRNSRSGDNAAVQLSASHTDTEPTATVEKERHA